MILDFRRTLCVLALIAALCALSTAFEVAVEDAEGRLDMMVYMDMEVTTPFKKKTNQGRYTVDGYTSLTTFVVGGDDLLVGSILAPTVVIETNEEFVNSLIQGTAIEGYNFTRVRY